MCVRWVIFLSSGNNFINSKYSNFLHWITIWKRRECSSAFSGAECWQKTFKYFTHDLMESIVFYRHAAYSVAKTFFEAHFTRNLLYQSCSVFIESLGFKYTRSIAIDSSIHILHNKWLEELHYFLIILLALKKFTKILLLLFHFK